MPENNHRLTKGTYTIYTFGCQMNVRESQTAQGILEQEGYVQALSAEQADVILFNTCCIRELAEQKAWTAIGATKKIKEKNPNAMWILLWEPILCTICRRRCIMRPAV